jgi:hypothetical protein
MNSIFQYIDTLFLTSLIMPAEQGAETADTVVVEDVAAASASPKEEEAK